MGGIHSAAGQPVARTGGVLTWSWARLVFVASALVAVVLILGLAGGLSFHGDEWAYIIDRRLTLESMLRPHNEHLVLLHVAVYRGMVEVLGTGSYLPFLLALMVTHVAMAAGVFALMRQEVPLAGALACSILLLFFGSGFDNLVWAFQMGFVGAAALGVWAMVSAHRAWLSAVLMTLALWTHGDALFYLAPTAVLLGRRWPVLLVPVASYGVWYVFIGNRGAPAEGPTIDYAVRLVGSIFGGVSGLGWVAGLIVAGAVSLTLATGRPSRFVLAGLAGLVSQIAILTISRAHFGAVQAEAPRYIYVAAPFVFMLLSGVRLPRLAWSVLFAMALLLNVAALPRGVAIYHAFLNYDRSIPLEERLAPYR